MSLKNSDLLYVQRGNNGFKMQAVILNDFIAANSGSLNYQGTVDCTQPVGTQLQNNPALTGDIYINTVSGVVSSAGTTNADKWVGITGEDIDNGQRVVWDGITWAIVGEEAGGGIVSIAEGDYISVDDTDPSNPKVSATGLLPLTGGALTGPLTSSSTATFTGDVTAPNVLLQGSLSQAQLKCDGGDFVVQTLNDGGSLQERLRIEDGDGLATFKGNVIVGASANNGDNDGLYLYNQGQILASRSAGTNSIFTGYTTDIDIPKVEITANGNATFKGNLLVGNSDLPGNVNGIYVQSNTVGTLGAAAVSGRNHTAGGFVWIGADSAAGVTTSSITESGAAVFSGTVQAAGYNLNVLSNLPSD